MVLGILALAANLAVFVYMLIQVKKTGVNPYKEELYTAHSKYKEVRNLAEDKAPVIA